MGYDNEKSAPGHTAQDSSGPGDSEIDLTATGKNSWEKIWPALAGGVGLFSDGYINNSIGSVITILNILYTNEYKNSPASSNIPSIAFAGTVVGQLVFGVLSDYWSRANSLLISTLFLIVFTILATGSYGGGTVSGMLAALTAWRFFIGIGVGGEYPAGSVACAEATGELKSGTRNRWFVFFTNFSIDAGFVTGAFVPMIVVLATTESHLRAAWRIILGLGVVCPLALLYLRMKLKEPEEYNRNKMNQYPYWLIIKFYWWRLLVVSLVWFVYDFSVYSFSIYSSSWLYYLQPADAPLWVTFGWNTVINLFYMPGSFLGAFVSDWIGPRYCLVLGLTLQGITGFLMTGIYKHLNQASQVGGFVVIYGIFLSLGEFGPGNNTFLFAAKTSATAVRGHYYGVAAAMGKVGAYVGTKVFPYIIDLAGDDVIKQGQYPFYVSSALCIFSAILAFFCLPDITQDAITEDDAKFKAYLIENGYDVSTLGTKQHRAHRSSVST